MSNIFNISDIIRNKKPLEENCCNMVYFLLKGDVVVYVGKTIFGLSRILKHIKAKEKDFDSFSAFLVDRDKLLEVELANINYYQPKYNKYAGGEYSFSKKLNKFIKREEKYPSKKIRKEYTLTHNGVKYKSLTSLAEDLGMSLSGVSRGVRRDSFCKKHNIIFKEN